jgi:CIC family chloride channel protein
MADAPQSRGVSKSGNRPDYWQLPYWRDRFSRRENQVFLAISIVIGALAGLAVVAFILLTERLGARLYPAGVAAPRRVLGPIIGSLSMGYLLARFFRDARGNGIVQTKSALHSSDGRITFHSVAGKFLCTSVTLASGIPLGPEGPSVAVGAGIASILGRKLGLSPAKVRALIPVGAAAAIAAAFNTPIAAVLFSLEEIIGDLNAPVLGSVVLASATGWMVLRLLLGNEPIFHVPQYEPAHPLEFAVYAVLGVTGGIVSGTLIASMIWLRGMFKRLPTKTQWIQPLAGGLVVGMAGWAVPEVLGVGYGHISDLLNGKMAIELAALLVLLKVFTVVVSSASGNAGGIFAPTLFIGAMLGGTVGGFFHYLLPGFTATPGVYALVGMGALFAGIVRTPMTSVILVFEVTRDYAIIVPLMIANLVSFFVSRQIHRETLYQSLGRQDGIHFPSEETRTREASRQVSHAIRQPEEVLPAHLTVNAAADFAAQSRHSSWPIMNEHGIIGVISAKTVLSLIEKGKGTQKLSDALGSPAFVHVHMDHSYDLALARMGAAGLDLLPVVSRLNIHELVGVIYLNDILRSYGISV